MLKFSKIFLHSSEVKIGKFIVRITRDNSPVYNSQSHIKSFFKLFPFSILFLERFVDLGLGPLS
jgi:hypothetical protein